MKSKVVWANHLKTHVHLFLNGKISFSELKAILQQKSAMIRSVQHEVNVLTFVGDDFNLDLNVIKLLGWIKNQAAPNERQNLVYNASSTARLAHACASFIMPSLTKRIILADSTETKEEPIKTEWDNPQKTILLQKASGRITWAILDEAAQQNRQLLDERGKTVVLITELADDVSWPLDLLGLARRIENTASPYEGLHIVINAPNQFRTMLCGVQRLIPQVFCRIVYANSLSEARRIAHDYHHGRYRPPC